MGMEFVLQAIKHKLIILMNYIAGVMQNDSVLILEICLPLSKICPSEHKTRLVTGLE